MRARSVIVYSVLRLLTFLVPLGLMMLFPIFRQLYWFAVGFAAIIGISLSVIFLRGPRDEVAAALAARRAAHVHRTSADDERELEDEANDIARGIPSVHPDRPEQDGQPPRPAPPADGAPPARPA